MILISLAHSAPNTEVNVFVVPAHSRHKTAWAGWNWSGPAGHFSRWDRVIWLLSHHEGWFALLVYLKNRQEEKVFLPHPHQLLENTLIFAVYRFPVPFSLHIPFACKTSIMRKPWIHEKPKIYQQCKKYVGS